MKTSGPKATDIAPRRWSNAEVPISESAVRDLYRPPGKFRLAVHSYPRGTAFSGSQRAGTCYVLKGSCQYSFAHAMARLRRGDIADLPAGDYQLDAMEDVVVLMAWELPPGFATS